MKIDFAGAVFSGTPEDIVKQFDAQAKKDLTGYMKDFEKRFEITYGKKMNYTDARSFLQELAAIGAIKLINEENEVISLEKYKNSRI